ncbi:MAG: sugar phosphate isomerase/epimerase [Acidobacteria bacterium]|nr:sugar phosphate isomerase/epimerase [Acidobacteriota bacterium]
MWTRRALLAALPAAALGASKSKLKIGVMDGILGLGSNPASVQAAHDLGFGGLQVTLGRQSTSGRLPLSNPETQARFVSESRRLKLPLVSTYIDILHIHCLKNDREAIRWTSEAIQITRNLQAPILMMVFFGDCALNTRAEMDAVIGPFKELARAAEKAKITLGFENTIKAEDDLRILDAVGSPALKIFYDIGNATNLYNVDPAAEIRALGKQRICQFHFKDKGFLGEGKVDVQAALTAIHDIQWQGSIVLETSSPSKNRQADLQRNRQYLSALLPR